jgi:arsenite methyltransferase
MRRRPRAWRRRSVAAVAVVIAGAAGRARPAPRTVDNASDCSYCALMRAFTHVTAPAAPDYALHVPPHLQLSAGLGVLAGIAGVGGLFGGLTPLLVVPLIGLGVLAGAFVAIIGVIISTPLRERARRRMLASIAWRGDERVLDVGCGNGFLLVEIAKRLSSGSATGIDLWVAGSGDQAAEAAWRNARLEGVADRVEIKNADARAMPFADGTFDVIVSSLMLHHAGGSADRGRVLDEMVRVLKPGGTLMLYDVAPLIAGAARQLRGQGVESIERSGRVMTLLSAHQSERRVDVATGRRV